MDKEQEARLLFSRGLSREFETEVEATAAYELSNWQPQPDGALITRPKWNEGAASTVAAQKVQAMAAMPVLAGWRVPLVAQRNKQSSRGANVLSIGVDWWWPTMDGSMLLAIVSYTLTASASSAVTVTPPADWVPVATVHSNDAPSTLSMRAYIIPNSPTREGTETFTFGTAVRRAQIELVEWRNLDPVDPFDTFKVNSRNDVRADTENSPVTDALFPTQVVVGAIAMVTEAQSVKPAGFPSGYFNYIDSYDPPHASVGKDDYWLNMAMARKVIFESGPQRFYGVYESDDYDEDEIAGRNVAMLLTFKAKRRDTEGDKDYLVVAREVNASTYGLESIDLDDIETGTWEPVGVPPQGATAGTLESRTSEAATQPLSMTVGPDSVLISAPNVMFEPAAAHRGLFQWDGSDLLRINRSPRANVVHFHSGHHRFYAGGTEEYPNRLFWSHLGDPTTWDENAWWDIGNTGEWLLDIATVNEGMMVAKLNSLHLVLGNGLPEAVLPLAGGNGMPGRCICPIPGGAVIVGQHHIWLYAGGAPELISRALDDWWAGVPHNFVHTAFVNGLVYIRGAADDSIVIFDTRSKIWWVDTPPEPFSVVYAQDGRRLYGGPASNAANLPVYFKDIPGTPKNLDDGGESFHARTQEFMLGSPSRPITPRWLHLSYRKRNYQAGHAPLVVTPTYDGHPQTIREVTEVHPVSGETLENGSFRIRLDVGVKARTAAHRIAFDFDYESDGTNSTCFDIEAAEFVYDWEERR